MYDCNIGCQWNLCEHCPQKKCWVEKQRFTNTLIRKNMKTTYLHIFLSRLCWVPGCAVGSVVLQLITEAQSDWDHGSVEDRPCLSVISSRFFLSVYGVKVLLGSCWGRCVHVSRGIEQHTETQCNYLQVKATLNPSPPPIHPKLFQIWMNKKITLAVRVKSNRYAVSNRSL